MLKEILELYYEKHTEYCESALSEIGIKHKQYDVNDFTLENGEEVEEYSKYLFIKDVCKAIKNEVLDSFDARIKFDENKLKEILLDLFEVNTDINRMDVLN